MNKELCFYVWLLKRDKMIYNNIGLVPFTYNKYFRRSCDPKIMEDLIQVGYLGLIKAVDNFDESRNVKFSAFATNIIKQCMVKGIENMTFALGTRSKKDGTTGEPNALPLSHFDTQDKTGDTVNIVEIKYYEDEDVRLDDMVIKIYIRFRNSLSGLDLAILERLEKDMKQVDIAEELHTSQKKVSIHKRRMQNKLKAMLL
jgi:RNA polymerase sigma factor (sigma-70 family)